ncbi:MAG: hypothetical protein RL748_1866 [Pseudomonadota bacterium]|jgi:HPt (histidine-containing phosphotransfer) domain-containing protein
MNQRGAEPLPVLPGIDIPLGLSHVGNNRPFYFQLLERFRTSQRVTITEFLRECGAGLQLEARRRVHSLRGVAANIGALEVQKTAGALELYLKNNGSYDARHPDLKRHLAALEQALTTVLDGLDHHHSQSEPAAPPPATAQSAQMVLEELLGLLREDRADAVYFFDTSRTNLAQLFDEATLTRVAAAIRQFDFHHAAQLLSGK